MPGTSAQDLSSAWAGRGLCSSGQGFSSLHEECLGSTYEAGGDTGHLVV